MSKRKKSKRKKAIMDNGFKRRKEIHRRIKYYRMKGDWK